MRRRTRRRTMPAPRVEALESRQLLSAFSVTEIQNGSLHQADFHAFEIKRDDSSSLATVTIKIAPSEDTDYGTSDEYYLTDGATNYVPQGTYNITFGVGVSSITLDVAPGTAYDETDPPNGDKVTVSIVPNSSGQYTIGSSDAATVTLYDRKTVCYTCLFNFLANLGTWLGFGSPGSNSSPGNASFGPILFGSLGSNNAPRNSTVGPISYGTGTITNLDSEGMDSSGFGAPLGQGLTWTNDPSAEVAGGSNGNGVMSDALPSLDVLADGTVLVANGAADRRWFDPGSPAGTYTEEFGGQDVLVADSSADGGTNDFKLTDPAGNVARFYGFESTIPTAERGKLKGFTDADGNQITATYNAAGQLTAEQRNDGTNYEQYLYTYVSGGTNAGRIASVALQRKVGSGGTWATVRQTAYTYYDGTQSYGNAGDLELEQVEDASGHVLDTTYYRYYTPADITAGAHGYAGGLKYRFTPQSYARLAKAVGTPLTATDSQVAPYADNYFEYDSYQRVTKEMVQGAGCSCSGSTGQGTYTYAYTTNTATTATDPNTWRTRTVETFLDKNGTTLYTNTVYTNTSGEVMLRDYEDVNDANNATLNSLHWITYDQYDHQGRLILEAQPSAMLGYSDTYADLIDNADPTGGLSSTYVSATAGVINLTDYGTSTIDGDVAGYVKDHKVEHGTAGTPILLDSTQYLSHADSSGATTYLPASHTVYRNADGTGAETTSYSYTWYTGTNRVQSMTTSAPVVSSAQDGPGTADVTTVVYDAYGRPTWTKDGDGYITYTAYDNATGMVVKSIADVDTTKTANFTGLPTGWATPSGGGQNLITQYQVDGLGRVTKETDPSGNVTYTVYDDPDHEVRTYRGWDATTGTATGPTVVTREDRAGSYDETLTMSATPTVSGLAGSYVPTGAEAISGIQSLTRQLRDSSNRVIEADDYTSLSGVTYSTLYFHLGTAGTNYNATTDDYDAVGQLSKVTDPTGTITKTTHDNRGRAVAVYVGTSDGTPSNMTQVAAYQYDGGGVGDGNLTQETTYPDATHTRVTADAYDWRDRLVATKSGVQATEDTATHRPITFYDLDNRGEITAVSQYDGDGVTLSASKPSASLLRAYSTTAYDDQGRAYQVKQYSVNQSTGAVSTAALTTSTWYDHRGDVIKVAAPGAPVTKDAHDGAGRLTAEYRTDGGGDSSWADAGTVTGDIVLTQTETAYDADGDPILTTTRDRFHDDAATATGALGDVTTGPKARVSYTASYYDAADRLTATVDVGTNGGAAYDRPLSVPARSDTALVTSYSYNAAGLVDTTTDPRGIVTKDVYDLLGRTTQTIQAYDSSVNGGNPTASQNGTTDYTYDGAGHVTSVTAVMPAGTPGQTTAYVYGVTAAAGGSAITSNDLLARVEYPDPTTGAASTSASNQAAYTYDALGEQTTATDPDGTTHTYSYDVLGRRTSDAVTTLGAGVDGQVRRHDVAYDTGGRAYLFTSYDAASGGSVVNQVEDVFNGLGQLTGEYQEQAGAVNTSTTPEVRYAYTEMAGGANNSRPTSITYPNGRVVHYVYNSGLDDSIGRISGLADDDGSGGVGTHLEDYSYLGLGTIVQEAHPETGIDLTYIEQPNDTHANTDGGDQYTGLDRFGRVIDQNWVNTATGASTDRFQYGYDRDGDRLYQNNLVDSALSELYHANSSASGDANTAYNPLGELTGFARGTLSASGDNGTQLDTIATASHSQSWSLDALGNWSGVTTDGTTTTKTYNAQNQVASVSGGTAPTYDNSGDTTSDSGQTYTYDAWDHLISAAVGGTTVASYAYDALGRRVTETYSGTATTNHLYYSSAWQVLEERQNGTAASNVKYQYVWGQAYVDDLVLRDTYSGGVRQSSQRLYAQHDANYDTTALVNTSGAVQERYEYDPYGAVTVLDASWNPRSGNASSYGWQYLHQGGRLDNVTGWYEFRNRDYIASEGRWAERDPMGLASGDANLYRFVQASPINRQDPTGLADWVYPRDPISTIMSWGGLSKGGEEDVVGKTIDGIGEIAAEAGKAIGEVTDEVRKIVVIKGPPGRPNQKSYCDINVGSALPMFPFGGGLQIGTGPNNTLWEIHPYFGIQAGPAPPPISGTISIAPGQDITPGFSVGASVFALLGLQGGIGGGSLPWNGSSYFYEFGIGSPQIGGGVWYIF